MQLTEGARTTAASDATAREILLYLSWLLGKRLRAGRHARVRLRLMPVHTAVDGAILHTFTPEDDVDARVVSVQVLAGLSVLFPEAPADGGAGLREDLGAFGGAHAGHRMLIVEGW